MTRFQMKPETLKRFLSACVMMFLFSVHSAFAQTPPKDASIDCNQPMPEPITQVSMKRIPFYAVSSSDGCWVFVTVRTNQGNRIAQSADNGIVVMRRSNGAMQETGFVHIDDPSPVTELSHDGKFLVVAQRDKVTFLDTAKLMSGQGDPILGAISDSHFSSANTPVLTADDKYLVLNQATTSWMSIIDLEKARASGFNAHAIVGGFPAGDAGFTVLSPDGRYLYMKSYKTFTTPAPPDTCTDNESSYANSIVIFDMERARANPEKEAIVTEIPVGCALRQIVLSTDGNTLYVPSMRENFLAALDVSPVRRGKPPVIIGKVPVGPAPVGGVLIDGGKRIVVADSNALNGDENDKARLLVIDTSRMDKGAAAIVGAIPADADPRWISVTADGHTIIVPNLKSKTLEFVDLQRFKLEPWNGGSPTDVRAASKP